jgi:hypothetical protein
MGASRVCGITVTVHASPFCSATVMERSCGDRQAHCHRNTRNTNRLTRSAAHDRIFIAARETHVVPAQAP